MVRFENLPRDARVDAPLWGQLTGLPPSSPARIEAAMRDDVGQAWRSRALYEASSEGTVDLAAAQPLEAAWSGSDAYRLYWSMQLVEEPVSPFSAYPGSVFQERLEVVFTASIDGKEVAEACVKRHFPFRCIQETWRGDTTANLFLPVYPNATQGVLVIGGSAGGFAWSNQVASLIAASGRSALAVAYFDWRGEYGLPTSLMEIPLEVFTRALDRLKAHPQVLTDDLSVVGFSKGTEAALLLATKRDDVRKVALYSPSAYVWEAARLSRDEEAKSSWTWRGEPLPFARFDADEDFYRTFDKTKLRAFHERALEGEGVRQRARIPVERTDAQILLLSGTEDGTWHAGPMSRTIVKRFEEVGRVSKVKHLAYENVGHSFLVPGLPANHVDGQWRANAQADKKAWGALRRHLCLF